MTEARLLILLEEHFETLDEIILSRQDAITGLLPASTAITAHGDYTDAWVRDNVYSIMSVWGLALAYKKHAPQQSQSHTLSQSVVKLMRGLLVAMMRQSDRVERFKKSLKPIDALHAKYGTTTGEAVVGDDAWGHLQLDATSLFLLMLAQMSASGLKIIYTLDEVDFIQNLVYYISRTYCTPDYGIWERGHKINHGTTEINGSSVGMAKAALEAMDGFNLFGDLESPESVIHVVASDIARSRSTLQSLLPRESNSKESDAALLSIIGYPAYAIEDPSLVEKTRSKIINKLAGNYGCKRFLLDGHQSVLEDPTRLHYEPSELRAFEDIESEWPLFFTYLLLDALMRDDRDAVKKWQEKLAPLFVEKDAKALLPELYYVPESLVAAEKAQPHSQQREANENLPLVWAQSLYMLAEMIEDGVIEVEDIDPLQRRKRVGHSGNSRPLVAVLAESQEVQEKLKAVGCHSETLEEITPLKMAHALELSKLHTHIGVNQKLSLTGRPLMETRTITTAQPYIIAGEKTLFLPYYFNPHGFYFSFDNKLLVEHFNASLKFLAQQWDYEEPPLITFLVREDMLEERAQGVVIALLHSIQSGECGGCRVLSRPLLELLPLTRSETLSLKRAVKIDTVVPMTLQRAICSHASGRRIDHALSVAERQHLEFSSDIYLIELLNNNPNRQFQATALALLKARYGDAHILTLEVGEITIAEAIERLYLGASACHDWAIVRYMASLSGKYDDRIEDALLDIVIRHKRLAVGRAYTEAAIFSKPLESSAIVETINNYCGDNVAESVLTQEITLHLGHLIRTEPELFGNMLTLRTWYFVQLLVGHISRAEQVSIGDAYERLLAYSPYDIYYHLRVVLKAFTQEVSELLDQENLYTKKAMHLHVKNVDLDFEDDVEDWAQWRLERGMIARFSRHFYKSIWYLLQQCQGLVIGDKYNIESRVGSELTLETTAGEASFALRIDALLQSIGASDYRQLNIEALESMARLFQADDQLYIESDLTLDVLIGYAVRLSWKKVHGDANYDELKGQAWHAFYHLPPSQTDRAFVEALEYLLTPQER